MEKWFEVARELGFENICPLDMYSLEPRSDIRSMCALNLCGNYGKNWTCPPICGDFDSCCRRLKEFSRGFLIQSVMEFDHSPTGPERNLAEQAHRERFIRLCQQIFPEYPQALCLGSGGCRVCPQCAYPEPCRYPEKAYFSLEGFGILTSQLCAGNGLQHRHGENSLTFTACILLP